MVQLCTADGAETYVVLNGSNDLGLGAVEDSKLSLITLLYRLHFVKDKSLSARDVLHVSDPESESSPKITKHRTVEKGEGISRF